MQIREQSTQQAGSCKGPGVGAGGGVEPGRTVRGFHLVQTLTSLLHSLSPAGTRMLEVS